MILLRPYAEGDTPALSSLLAECVRNVNSRDYTPEQVEAWCAAGADLGRLHARLSTGCTIVAENGNAEIVGFANMHDDGYFDYLFVGSRSQRLGIASRLADEAERYARSRGAAAFTSEVSITALPFFERRGYVTVKRQTVMCGSVGLDNFVMRKEA